MYYVSRGNVPHKRHTQHRASDGSLYAEELFGMEGFHGRSSLLYHLRPPTETHLIEALAETRLQAADGDAHHHRLVKSDGLEPRGDIVSGRIPLFYN
ncbi:MAG: homogentisate 1,2-dioxygenase, partial [Chloroflexota bacterium]|nr:homogentisate 1,2-dioxygenase [Chloroflexota bacterium]